MILIMGQQASPGDLDRTHDAHLAKLGMPLQTYDVVAMFKEKVSFPSFAQPCGHPEHLVLSVLRAARAKRPTAGTCHRLMCN